jgi:hypothetical protein
MRMRPRRRNLVVWRQSAGPTRSCAAPPRTRAKRIRRWIRTGVLLAVIGLMPLTLAVWARRWQLLAGSALTIAGVMLRGGQASIVLLPGLLLLLSAPIVPASSAADRTRHSELERELAVYATPAQRRDLEATLDRYPDSTTRELRDILSRQASAARGNAIPGSRGY